MNAIQKISLDLLRERGGTPFDPAGRDHQRQAEKRPGGSEPARVPYPVRTGGESVDRLPRLAG